MSTRSATRESTSALRRTASTRSSRAQARTAKLQNNDEENVEKVIQGKVRGKPATSKKVLENEENPSLPEPRKKADLIGKPTSIPATVLPSSISSSMRPPLSPSKSASNMQRLPLSPVKRHNGNAPTTANSGSSPPKMMKNDENEGLPRKCLPSPIRGGPPQSPIRAVPPQSPSGRVQSPFAKKVSQKVALLYSNCFFPSPTPRY